MENNDSEEPFFNLDGIEQPNMTEYVPDFEDGAVEDAFDTSGIVSSAGDDFERTEPAQEPIVDPELATLIEQNTANIGTENVDSILRANDRFNTPMDTGDSVDPYYTHRSLLERLPTYIQAGDNAGIAPEDSTSLLTDVLDSITYPDTTETPQTATRLTRILQNTAESGQPMTETAQSALLEAVTVGEEKEISPNFTLDILHNAQQSGLNIEQGAKVISEFASNGNLRQVGYYAENLNQAIKALNVAHADPELVAQAFTHMNALDPELRKGTHEAFVAFVSKVGPDLGYSTNELLTAFNDKIQSGITPVEAMETVIPEGYALHDEKGLPVTPPERYFVQKTGELVHSVMPYQTERSFGEGMQDLQTLTAAKMSEGETVAEGSWVFDPALSRWYSLGGTTKYLGGGDVRQNASMYDFSKLSEKPIYIHIHPSDFASWTADRATYTLPSAADFTQTAKMLDASGQPVQLRTLIAHSEGITEFTHPADPEAIRQVGETFDDIRNGILASNFSDMQDFERYVRSTGVEASAAQFIDAINSELPEGFRIKLHRTGTSMETLLRGEQ